MIDSGKRKEDDGVYHTTLLIGEMEMARFLTDYVDVDRFLPLCRQCSNYNKSWGCPPFDFSPMEFWMRFRRLRIFAVKMEVDPNIPGKVYSAKEKVHIYRQYLQLESDQLYRKLYRLEQETPGSMLLYPGNCHLCGSEACARSLGQPCRYPKKLRYSMEALGGDVSRIAEEILDCPLQWIDGEKLPEYLIQLGGLLYP